MTEAEKYKDLVCPIGKHPLVYDGGNLVCPNCSAKFPVNDGIPNLIIDDAVLPAGIDSYEELKCFKETEAGK